MFVLRILYGNTCHVKKLTQHSIFVWAQFSRRNSQFTISTYYRNPQNINILRNTRYRGINHILKYDGAINFVLDYSIIGYFIFSRCLYLDYKYPVWVYSCDSLESRFTCHILFVDLFSTAYSNVIDTIWTWRRHINVNTLNFNFVSSTIIDKFINRNLGHTQFQNIIIFSHSVILSNQEINTTLMLVFRYVIYSKI